MFENQNEKAEWQRRMSALGNYFRRLAEENDHETALARADEWKRGLHISERLLELSEASDSDISELKALLATLEADLKNYGSGWFDLYLHTEYLLEMVENDSSL